MFTFSKSGTEMHIAIAVRIKHASNIQNSFIKPHMERYTDTTNIARLKNKENQNKL